jgi:hypothetical protein
MLPQPDRSRFISVSHQAAVINSRCHLVAIQHNFISTPDLGKFLNLTINFTGNNQSANFLLKVRDGNNNAAGSSLPNIYMDVNRIKIEEEISFVLQSRRPDTNMLNVMEALGYSSDKFQHAFDVAREMDRRNLVKLLYSNFNAGKVIVEFTLLAKK